MDFLNTKFLKMFLLTFLVVILFVPYVADAQLNVNYPRIPVPGGSLDLNKAVEAGRVTIGTIAVFIYVVAIWIAGIVAFITLIYAGLLYIFSGTNPGNRRKANDQLAAVAWGVGIVLFSFWMLFMINPDVINLRISGTQSIVGGDSSPRIDFSSGSAICSGTFSCMWEGGRCQLDTENTNCEAGCTGGEECEAINELLEEEDIEESEVQEVCESFSNVSCYGDDEPILAENYAGCFWHSTTQTSGVCERIERCEDGLVPTIQCSHIEDPDECRNVEHAICVTEEEKEEQKEDPEVAGTFSCGTDETGSQCMVHDHLNNCNTEDGFIPDDDRCDQDDMLTPLNDSCGELDWQDPCCGGDESYTCIKG
ncbi:MAG: hypothetical protein WDZ39_00670 [Candidatus Spechtbacterales bacterium]